MINFIIEYSQITLPQALVISTCVVCIVWIIIEAWIKK